MRRWGFAVPLMLPFLLVLHLEQGGAWTWAPVVFVFGVVPLLDFVFQRDRWNPSAEEAVALEQDIFYRGILYAWVPLQLILLGWVAWRVQVLPLDAWEFAGIVVSTGVVTGALGITIAHELGHKLDRREQWLGRALLMSVCYMHFMSSTTRAITRASRHRTTRQVRARDNRCLPFSRRRWQEVS